MWLLSIFAREREARIDQTIELGKAYRGTALLLRDLLEEDDEYTGHHTEDVVDLSVRVADQMGVGEDVRRETELGALLHDIGKINIPNSIINKPGPLDDEEWAIMKTHTIEGQKMLDQVGGLLGNVGSSSARRTNTSTAAATRTAWPATTSRSPPGSWPRAIPSTQ